MSSRVLLGSGGFRTPERISFAISQMQQHFGNISTLLFIPYALADHNRYLEDIKAKNLNAGYQIKGIHEYENPIQAINEAEGIFVGGGNTFRLLNELQKRNLIDPIKEKVRKGTPYFGISAGTVIAAPTIQTTNDMPIVVPSSLNSLNLIPFQINPHYYEGNNFVKSPEGKFIEHYGETRDLRLAQFHEEQDTPVVGLWEGGLIKCTEGSYLLIGSSARIFIKGQLPIDVEEGTDLSVFLSHSKSPLIPLPTLLGNPTQFQARLSEDGRYVSWIAPSEDKDVLNVWIRERTEPMSAKKMVTKDELRGIRLHFWAADSKTIIYLQDASGDENFHLLSVDISNANWTTRDLTPFQGVRAQQPFVTHKYPDEILVGLNLRNRQVFDIYRINLNTGAVVLDTENPGDVIDWIVDDDFKIRACLASVSADGSTVLRVRSDTSQEWKELLKWPFGENVHIIGFNKNGDGLFLLTSIGADTTRLVEVELDNGAERREISKNELVDVGYVLFNPYTCDIDAVSFEYLKKNWISLKQEYEFDFTAFKEISGTDGVFHITARTADDRFWIIEVDNNSPVSYYLYDRLNYQTHQKAELLFHSRPDLLQYPLTKTQSVIIPSSDNEKLVSYLTLPLQEDLSSHERKAHDIDIQLPSSPLPLILLVHGGPWVRDSWGFNVLSQWLANRGYAVLCVNYRGSTGFGKRFVNISNGEWSGAMQRDLTEAVEWAIQKGIAHPKKIAIMGGSYGGYATLAGITITPHLYACGVDIVGPSHVKTLFQSIPPYWTPMKKQLILRIGDVENDEELNRRISPLFHVDNIRVPLIIGQGANDPRVKQAESDQIVQALREKNLPYEYIIYTDEGHGFARPPNRLHFYSRVEKFLSHHLGGRFANIPSSAIESNTAIIDSKL